jgi:hypothetical protein
MNDKVMEARNLLEQQNSGMINGMGMNGHESWREGASVNRQTENTRGGK